MKSCILLLCFLVCFRSSWSKKGHEETSKLNATEAPTNATQAALNMTQTTMIKALTTNASSETAARGNTTVTTKPVLSFAPTNSTKKNITKVTSKKPSVPSVKRNKPTLSGEERLKKYYRMGENLRAEGLLPTIGTKKTKPDSEDSPVEPTTGSKKTTPESEESPVEPTTGSKETTPESEESPVKPTTGSKETTPESEENQVEPNGSEETKPESKGSQDGPATDTKETKPGPKPLSRTPDSSHFAVVFLVMIALLFGLYALYHNRQKIIAVVVEGRSINGRGGRERYRKLDSESGLEPEARIKNSNEVYVY